ncbi:MAG: type 4a pilus biogenesis protein PilO [Candidatus Levyibacteriota bacterium]
MDNQSQKNGRYRWVSQQLLSLQNKKEASTYFYLILTFFAVSFLGFFALMPAFSTISALQKQLADSKNVYKALQTKISALHTLSQQYTTLESNLSIVYLAIPTSSEIPLFTRQVQVLAQEDNLSLTQFSTSPIEYYPLSTQDKLYGYTFSLDVAGQEQDINSFLNSVTNFSRIISVEKISTGKTDKGQLSLSLSGKAYLETK